MKYFLLLATLIALRGQAACLPDPLLTVPTTNKNLLELERTIQLFHEDLAKEIPPGIDMVIRLESLNDRINADVTRDENQLIVQIFGGMLKHPQMSSGVLQLLLCHELGHFLGGPPLKSRAGWSSTEGQADYYSASKCAHFLGFDEASFTEAAYRLTSIYASVTNEQQPDLHLCEEQQVTRTNYGYPSSQCRLDTLIAGWRGFNRPACWFFE